MSGQRISDATRAKIKSVWPDILAALAAGELVKDKLAELGLSADMLRAWRAETAGAKAEWEEAREQSADSFADKALAMALHPVQVIEQEGGKEPLIIRLDPAHARNAIDTLKWAARIRNPRLYSDKAQLDVNVRTVDLTRIIAEANARLAGGRAGRTLEHQGAMLDQLPVRIAADAAGAAIQEHAARLLELL